MPPKMKSIKVLCTIGVLSFLLSCTNQEEAVTFFIDNQLTENLIVQRLDTEVDPNVDIFRQIPLDLRASESFSRYIQRLRELDIRNFEFRFQDYQGNIQNGQLYLEDILLGQFDSSINQIRISDQGVIQRIEELFLERTQLDFTFVGESQTNHYLSVSVTIEMKGTFVH